MAGEDSYTGFHPDNFTREQIMRRLRGKAIQLWGLQESDIDNLDPVVDLLMGACAVEFERTAHEINASQARVLERLAQLMVPEVLTNARPSHAIMHARAELPVVEIKAEEQFSLEKEVVVNSKMTSLPLMFSPAVACKLFDASIICQAVGNRITFYESPVSKGENVYASAKQALSPYSLWIGIKINKKVQSLKGMSFFFDWKNEPDKAKFLPLLSLSQWETADAVLNLTAGPDHKQSSVLSEFDTMAELESHVLKIYQHHFLTIAQDHSLPAFSKYPAIFEDIFPKEQLIKLKEELLWVQVHLPEGIPLQAVSEVYCAINCFPVMNRRLHVNNRPYALSSKLNIIPLKTDDHFLSIRKVHSESRLYHSITLQRMNEVEDGSYAVRQGGVARFDQRNASRMLSYLHEMLRDESAAFSAFGSYAMNTEIKSLEQNLTRLQMHFLQKVTEQALRTHLLLHTKAAEDVWIEFWSTQGETANGLSSGKKADLLTGANLRKESLTLMSASSGGKRPMDETEKLHAYRYTLLTRSRIVTQEDIKAACFAELGSKIEHVVVQKGVKKDASFQKGFVRTLDVVLTPAAAYTDLDWDTACRELQAFLERKKMFLTDIQVYTQTKEEAYVANRR